MNEKKVVIGIDPGTKKLGYGIIELSRGQLRYITSGVIVPKATLKVMDRLKIIHKVLQGIFRENGIQIVATETPFVGQFPKPALVLGCTVGIIAALAWENGLDITEYTPTQVKAAVFGGKATKGQVGIMVKAILGLDFIPLSDAGDALAVAICHCNKI